MKNSSESSENPSRPVSRYVSNDANIFDTLVHQLIHFFNILYRYRDLDDIGELVARSKSRMSIGSGIEDLYYNSRVKFSDTDSSHVLI